MKKNLLFTIVFSFIFSFYGMSQCEQIGIIGEFNDWADDVMLEQDTANPDVWTGNVGFFVSDDINADSVIELKFRANQDWTVNWGGDEFPADTGYMDGPNILAPLVNFDGITVYHVTFNCTTGEYVFTYFDVISLIGEFNGWGDDYWMKPFPDSLNIWSTVLVLDNASADLNEPPDGMVEVKFRQNANWAVNWGGDSFPADTGYLDGPNISVPLFDGSVTTGYMVSFDVNTNLYNFELQPEISLIGEFNGWAGDHYLTQDMEEPFMYHTMISFDDSSDTSGDSLVEVKFRQDADWAINWGGDEFPADTGYQDGPNILVPFGSYRVSFNYETKEYLFEPFSNISLIGEFNGWADDFMLAPDPEIPDLYTGEITFFAADDNDPQDGFIEVKFRQDADWAVNWGGESFPAGIGIPDGPNILIPLNANDYSEATYKVFFNTTTLDYSFEYEGCGAISMIGEFNEWADDYWMMPHPENPNLWSAFISFTEADDIDSVDGFVELKFRANADWSVNWGAEGFPTDTAYQGGPNIKVPLGSYFVDFNCLTGVYNFTEFNIVSMIGEFNGWADDYFMFPDPENADLWSTHITFYPDNDNDPVDSIIEVKFRQNESWDVNWGGSEFPAGTAEENGPNIPVPYNPEDASATYFVTFNTATLEYSFESQGCGRIGIVGEFNGWADDLWMMPDPENSNFWHADLFLTEENDVDPVDGFIELKFRQDGDWAINWGGDEFPADTGYQDGPNIMVPIGHYSIFFDCSTGYYSFETPCRDIGIVGEFNDWGNDVWMHCDPMNPDVFKTKLALTSESDVSDPQDGIVELKFRENADWAINWGGDAFPADTGYQDGPNIMVPLVTEADTTFYDVTFNAFTGFYEFDLFTSIADVSIPGFNIYPIPANDMIYVKGIDNANEHNLSYKVLNTLGKQTSLYGTIDNNNGTFSINTSQLNNGIYILVIVNDIGQKSVEKFVIHD